MGHGIHDHFKFAAEDHGIVGREVYMPIYELAKRHDWHKGGIGYKALSDAQFNPCHLVFSHLWVSASQLRD